MAGTYDDLCGIVLDALLEATPTEVGAVLSVPTRPPTVPTTRAARNAATDASAGKSQRGMELEVTVHRHRTPGTDNYIRVSEYVSNEVLASREAILAEDVARNRYLQNRESLSDLGATSLICAPILFGEKVLGLIHLYCTDPLKALDTEDLEFTMAVAKQLGGVIHNLQKQQSLHGENRSLRDQLQVESELVGESPAIRELERQIGLVADTNATCLIRGESGVGKELVARAVHYSSPRKDGPFVCLNCAALTETLLESELFGHEKGSFTGATEKKIGKFEAANHGTIFLDEIGEMNVGTQAKLLRILEGHPFERVGGSVPIRVDVRVVAATNQPLEEAVREGTFRRDLFFRLQVVEIRVPPLRERKTDVPLLAEHFLPALRARDGPKDSRLHAGGAEEDGGLPLARQRPRTAQRGRTRRGPGRRPDAGRRRHLAVVAGGVHLDPRGRRRLRSGAAGGNRETPHPANAGVHRLEQEPGGGDLADRAIDAGSEDQGV